MTKRNKRTGKLPKLSKTPVPVLLSVVVGTLEVASKMVLRPPTLHVPTFHTKAVVVH